MTKRTRTDVCPKRKKKPQQQKMLAVLLKKKKKKVGQTLQKLHKQWTSETTSILTSTNKV